MMLSLILLSMALLAGMIVQYFTIRKLYKTVFVQGEYFRAWVEADMRRMERSNGH